MDARREVVAPQTRDQVRTDVQNEIRDAIRQARDAAREAAQSARDEQAAEIAIQRQGLDPAMTIGLLEGQINGLSREIAELTSQLGPNLSGAREAAINAQLQEALARRTALRAQVDAIVSAQTGAGSFDVPAGPFIRDRDSTRPLALGFLLACVVFAIGVPLVRAFTRRFRRTSPGAPAPVDIDQRLTRMEQAIDAVAIEVERVSEGQRYTNRHISELRGLPAPNVGEHWPLAGAREPVAVERPER